MHCLNGGDGLFAIYTVENGTTETMAYVLKDHLGSIHCLVDEAGAKTEELSIDAWGPAAVTQLTGSRLHRPTATNITIGAASLKK